MRSKLAMGALVMASALAPGCAGEGTTLPVAIPGTYALVSFGGNALPTTVYWPGGPRTILAGSLAVGDDGRYTRTRTLRGCADTSCAPSTSTETGAWAVLADGSLTFRADQYWSDPQPLVLARDGRITFCASAAGQPCQPDEVYARQQP